MKRKVHSHFKVEGLKAPADQADGRASGLVRAVRESQWLWSGWCEQQVELAATRQWEKALSLAV